jgi:hypothetical protein
MQAPTGFSLGSFFDKAADFYIAKETAKIQAAANPATATDERTAVAGYTSANLQNGQAVPWGVQDFAAMAAQPNQYLGLNNGLLMLIAAGLAFYLAVK